MRTFQFSWDEFATVETNPTSANPKWPTLRCPFHGFQTRSEETTTGQIQTRAIETPRPRSGTFLLGAVLVSLDFNRAVTLDMTEFGIETDRNQTNLMRVMDYVWLPQTNRCSDRSPATARSAFGLGYDFAHRHA